MLFILNLELLILNLLSIFIRGDSSQKARDLHLLQQLRNELQRKEGPVNLGAILEIRYAGIVNQALDLLLDSRHLNPDAFVECVESIVAHYTKAKALDAESRLLLSRSRLLSRLVRLYIHLKDMQSRPPDYDTVTNSSTISYQVTPLYLLVVFCLHVLMY